MGFQSGHIETGMVDLRRDLPILSIDEINFLLYFIGESSFKGKDMKQVYALSLKLNSILQHQLKINKKEALNKNQ
tara:strand:+ start:221 stop:445 length:225 start_codon:yes stop_codon:yes gene_type:complete